MSTDTNNIKKNLSYKYLSDVVNGYLNKTISDDEMASWIKEIYENGMSIQESADYTRAIING